MQISVKTLTKRTTVFQVEDGATVGSLKDQICEDGGIPADQIRLIFGGKSLADAGTLEENGLKSGDTVHQVLQLRGGAAQ